MLKKKHLILHTTASVDEAERLLQEQTVKGSPFPDHPLEVMKDTVRMDDKPFRGEIGGGGFKLTRRRRGDKTPRVQLEGRLNPKEKGGTEIKAAISASPMWIAGLIGGLVGVGIVGGGAALGELPVWVPALMVAAQGAAVAISSKLFQREASRTFSALRDAIPESAPQAVAAVSAPVEESAPNLAEHAGVKQG